MKEKFEVIEIENQTMVLKANYSSSCQSCSANSGCGTGILATYFNHYTTLSKPLQSGVGVGDVITLEIAATELFWRAFQLYIFPLLALFLGAILAAIYFPMNELGQIAFGFFGFSVALIAIKYFIK